mgnify:CR=1 FL=1
MNQLIMAAQITEGYLYNPFEQGDGEVWNPARSRAENNPVRENDEIERARTYDGSRVLGRGSTRLREGRALERARGACPCAPGPVVTADGGGSLE